MNQTVLLVQEWGKFEEKRTGATIEDFFRFYLAESKKGGNRNHADKTPSIPLESVLMRMLGRIMKVHSVYAGIALDGCGVGSVEEFSMLLVIYQMKSPKKIEVIHACLHEISTGTDMLSRLKKAGYFTEYKDKEDKRSVRLTITPKGEKVLSQCKIRIASLAKMMLGDMEDEDKQLCIQLLRNIEGKFSPVIQHLKEKSFEEILADAGGALPAK